MLLVSSQMLLFGLSFFLFYMIFIGNLLAILSLILVLFLFSYLTSFRLEYNDQLLIQRSLFHKKAINILDINYIEIEYHSCVRVYNNERKLLLRITNDLKREEVLKFIKGLDPSITIIDNRI
jgi:hypothetical protein